MTENKWLISDDPGRMIAAFNLISGTPDRIKVTIKGNKLFWTSHRKMRLFGVACCRQVWHLLTDKHNHHCIETAERYADGLATNYELNECCHSDFVGIPPRAHCGQNVCRLDAKHAAIHASWDAVTEDNPPNSSTSMSIRKMQADLAREIFGNPYKKVEINHHCITPTVAAIAKAAYEERNQETGQLDTANLAVLADALEDANCTIESILRHLRGFKRCIQCSDDGCSYCNNGWVEDWWLRTSSPSPAHHVRGCWALDLILGKE